MKRRLKALTIIFLFLVSLIPIKASADATPPSINAAGCALIDASTGQMLYGKNENTQYEPASTTKVMTALIVLEKCKLNDEVTIQQDVDREDGTRIGLKKGDVLTVHELLLGLLLDSGNDAADALAYHVSGSIDEFAKLMNAKAKELGATNTNFKNPSGLPDPQHLTTPHDLALFLREAVNNQDFIKISTTPSYTLAMRNDPQRTINLYNKNYMINKGSKFYYPNALCGKNGYTITANQTYVASAKKDDHILVASFLYAVDKNQNFEDMKTVFDYGFNNFSWVHIYSKNDKVSEYKINNTLTIPLLSTKDLDYVVPKGDETKESYDIKVEDKDLSKQSFNEGDEILKGKVYVNDKELETVDLAAGASRNYTSLFDVSSLSKNSIIAIYGGCALAALGAATGLGILIKQKFKK
ncbi:D-alanyl-D-alanine carboxypeptidase family protein [Clostridium saccharobutylicum]|uniref:serine-type D-Ala-D-Ala carboxypeptidase n=1 Tax=Clostridium saccharobutylicum DSM 13864 TaxID=1345695 RepID=U5MQF1_CLOSA|nr:D-alanyl-D-alanine carboxypeptidase family protein [Clostridium saccharobutylicum]AGX41662.1 D-alanyl-D-alanine carboxypeptidase DacF [Clostridium saccharobutylicum DSM 13864]AQR88945.1 D-alanyl-D-alanine carboxypeptidase DacB precursor [Clostridium saccharobutylicum]AQR98846.1 D-alanyl-D-alanine carboxypeptidase DacB precursor [Clostridium saccharobutylicum]AQS08564.1 D-alanyl-D-alanine carboxypeptidase DacB precursor [Clostridium saccharobutylicum]AQS12834.1 D-alanyl-D-alanine carboxypept